MISRRCRQVNHQRVERIWMNKDFEDTPEVTEERKVIAQ
jgi:hypothetical protein